MRLFSFSVLFASLLALPVQTLGQSITPDEILLAPAAPTVSDPISAEIHGSFVNSGFELTGEPSASVFGFQIFIDVFSQSTDGYHAEVLTPFTTAADIGQLPAGDYLLINSFYVNGMADATMSKEFSVAAVPLPGSVWLLVSGLLGLGLCRRQNTKRMHFPERGSA